MTNQIDFSKPYWFYLSPDVYVAEVFEEAKLLLYHTCTGGKLEVEHQSCILLIREVYKPGNLGVIKLPILKSDNTELIAFIKTIVKLEMGRVIAIDDEKQKPINLLPILSLSKDVDKLKNKNDFSLIIPDLISYLSELNIYINGKCTHECSACSKYYKQVKSCFKSHMDNELHPSVLQKALNQLTFSRVKRINILGGNIFKYTYWDNLTLLMNEFEFDFHLWVNCLNFPSQGTRFLPNNIVYEILVTFPIQISSLHTVFREYGTRSKFHFLIENEEQYGIAVNLIERIGIKEFSVTPIYTGNNIDFFSENVFLEKEDIFSSVISMREIFRNQKLNANNFGSLTILSNGSIKANINTKTIGNIYQDTILELIYNEMVDNSAWRVIRDNDICKSCLYQFLCPPPSNYEMVIGKPNLCHIKS